MCAVVSAGVLLRKAHASSSARTSQFVSVGLLVIDENYEGSTFQSVDSPLLEFFQGDFRGGRDLVEVQAMLVFLLLVCWSCELLLLVVDSGSPFRVDSIDILPDHCVVV